ncbi:MAG: thiol reductant ABC exporter subunit CydD [Wenzhouxiangella sp.]|nr:MAG: thiol reductant ABC exporter subunit CydD [Wenzhouxiangella sp.]
MAALEALTVVAQAGLLAWILARVIVDGAALEALFGPLAALLATWLIRAGVVSYRSRLTATASSQIRRTLRHELFDTLTAAGPLYRGPRGTGQLSTGLIEQVDVLDPFYSRYLPQAATALLVPGAILIAAFLTDWLAGALLLLAAPLIPGFMIIIGMGAEQISRRQQDALGRLSGLFHDRLQGLDTLRRFGAEQREIGRMAEFSEQFRERTMQVLRVAFLSSAVLEFFSAVAIATLAIYIGLGLLGMIEFAGAPSLTLFKGLFILVMAPEFFTPLRTLAVHWHDRAGALAAAQSLRELLEAPPARTEPEQPAGRVPRQPCGLQVRDLRKRFPGRSTVLQGLDLQVAAGEKLVISGPSGCGKSTLLALLAGFGEPDSGDILIDSIDIACFTRAQLAAIRGYLGQRPLLFPANIDTNIRFGDPSADQSALARAVRLSGLDEMVSQLPEGLATMLGQDGLGVSGGQARRIALARVLLKPRPVLLLDEPTASLDADTERQFWHGLDAALTETPMTVVCASHSPLAAEWADRVLALRDGRLKEIERA